MFFKGSVKGLCWGLSVWAFVCVQRSLIEGYRAKIKPHWSRKDPCRGCAGQLCIEREARDGEGACFQFFSVSVNV